MDLTTVFRMPAIHDLHRTKTERIHQALGRGAGRLITPTTHAPATGYALAHHVLEGAEHAARVGDPDTFVWYSEHPDAAATELTPAAGPLTVVPAEEQLLTSYVSDTPYYVLGPTTQAAPGHLHKLTLESATLAADQGFGDLVDAHAPIVCLLTGKPLGSPLRSWTISRMPGTVFLDYVPDNTVMVARDLIHEAGHNWLNDALTATGCEIDNTRTFYSPWKKTHRPAYGFIHGCWSFSLVTLYVAAVLPTTTGETHTFLTAYLDRQRAQLRVVTGDHETALRTISDSTLRTRLRIVYRHALAF
ncbi:aKG-HExxH-type peptide beta-hydroxylase [Peterkaempfera bronchialis]|uniref:HEXXH motif domain-containing protein n=1 Tax=Peterkaempfera bronchialis TaxID=2126346 RepID=A0A345SXU9_9ACTN|nr:HEXXH motif-containing putative peptide modification protein [Peterkaempfera bronchialis]AXI78554.1 HEXXH motif domain-containing protein [Peterkaempfera bronchialis]